MKKSSLFRLHQITGLVLGIFLILISISGAILVFKEELIAANLPIIERTETEPIISLATAYQSIRNLHPNAKILQAKIPTQSKEAFQFTILDSPLQNQANPLASQTLTLDPKNGQILGPEQNQMERIIKWILIFHNSFQLEKWGEWVLGILSILFVVSFLSGIIHYRKKIFPVLLFNKHLYHWRNLHQLIGVWTLVFQMMMAGTGFWMQRYVFKASFYQPNSYQIAQLANPNYYPNYHLDSALGKLKNQYPDFMVSSIYFAKDAKSPTAMYGSRQSNAFIHSKKLADAIFLDSLGNLKKTRWVTEINKADQFDIINAQVHYGQYGGLLTKIIYALLGLAIGLLCITGYWMNLQKRNPY